MSLKGGKDESQGSDRWCSWDGTATAPDRQRLGAACYRPEGPPAAGGHDTESPSVSESEGNWACLNCTSGPVGEEKVTQIDLLFCDLHFSDVQD